MNVMLDLETMGTDSNAAIIAIGAVTFDINGTYEQFYKTINLDSSVQTGGIIDASTVLWWMKQSDAARNEFNRPSVSIYDALLDFGQWLGTDEVLIWGNGSDFDNVILTNAYKRARIIQPWKYWNNRCYRTVAAMNKDVPINRSGTAHNALDDAMTQADHLIRILRI